MALRHWPKGGWKWLSAHCPLPTAHCSLHRQHQVRCGCVHWRASSEQRKDGGGMSKWAHPPLRRTESTAARSTRQHHKYCSCRFCWPQQAAVAMACSCHTLGMYLWLTPTRAVTSATLDDCGPTPSPARDFPISRGCEGGGQSQRPSSGPNFQPISGVRQARKPPRSCTVQWKSALPRRCDGRRRSAST